MKVSRSWSSISTRTTEGTSCKKLGKVHPKTALGRRNRNKKNGKCKVACVTRKRKMTYAYIEPSQTYMMDFVCEEPLTTG